MDSSEEKYLSFKLGEETYGMPIKKVKEILSKVEITNTLKTQNHIKGVLNLRGKDIPIIDLRMKLGIAKYVDFEHSCIIVTEICLSDYLYLVGIIVDAVGEVLYIKNSEIEPPPQYEAEVEGNFLAGFGKLKEKVILIIDIDKVLSYEEIAFL